jgi:hypothetical protein
MAVRLRSTTSPLPLEQQELLAIAFHVRDHSVDVTSAISSAQSANSILPARMRHHRMEGQYLILVEKHASDEVTSRKVLPVAFVPLTRSMKA